MKMASKKKQPTKKADLYEVTDEGVERKRKICPRCGPGTFLADHGSRLACGKCGYTEWKQKKEEK
jgi:small subunit ribosomal protein S27Ae